VRDDVTKTSLKQKRDKPATDPARREAVAPGVQDGARQFAVGEVDRQGLPIIVIRDQHPARAYHADHLTDCRIGIGDVLKHPIDPAGIETRIVEGQLSGVGNVERQAHDITVALTL
jgi:hypothetical protein